MSHDLTQFAFVSGVASILLAGAVWLIKRATFAPVRVAAAFAAGSVTDYVVRAAIRHGLRPAFDSEFPDWVDWAYNGTCGLTVRFARLLHADYHRNDEWILPGEETAAFADFWFHVTVWTSIFAAIYLVALRRTQRTI